MYDRFLIAPIKTGLVTDIKAWQVPEDAFSRLNNAYVHKGVVRKRFGSTLTGAAGATPVERQLTSRLRIEVDTTDGAGAAAGTVPGAAFYIGQLFSIGAEIFTVVDTGAPAVMLTTGGATTMTYNTTTGAYVFAGAAAATDVYFYPAEPVMGFVQDEEDGEAANITYAFDTQFIYYFDSTVNAWERDGTVVLQGDDSDFVWATNWTGVSDDLTAVFITNYNATIGAPGPNDDPMYVYRGGTWNEFRPVCTVDANLPETYVQTAKIIIPFKDRLLLLSTIERDVAGVTNAAYTNRCRYSHNGSPFPADVPDNVEAAVSSAWLTGSNPWNIGATTERSTDAGWIDASTTEEIQSAEFIRDRLIVYFENSTWEIVDTGNNIMPFRWQKINTELGSKSLKSPVPFDKAVLTVGTTAIHGCTGTSVTKINEEISDQLFEIRKTDEGMQRVCGIRDYFAELVYWSHPTDSAHADSRTFPNQVFIYNYLGDSWGTATDTITAFGYYDQEDEVSQIKYKQVVAGNQHGFVFVCDTDVTVNAAAMQITNIETVAGDVHCTIVDHTHNDNEFIEVFNLSGATLTGSGIYKVSVIDSDTLELLDTTLTGTYEGGGTASRVSRMDMLSKQWNFYIDKGKNFYLAKIAFAVKGTTYGEVTVDYYPSSTQLSMIESGVTNGSIMGDNILQTYPFTMYPLENSQERIWHPVYFQTEGECVQIRIYHSETQMKDSDIVLSDFQLEGMVVHARQTSERLQ